jgi:hypothetical protein
LLSFCSTTCASGTTIQIILVVLELATGGELFDFLAFTGPFEDTLARTYFQQLIAGIAHCHSKAIAHRDIKPEVRRQGLDTHTLSAGIRWRMREVELISRLGLCFAVEYPAR